MQEIKYDIEWTAVGTNRYKTISELLYLIDLFFKVSYYSKT